MSLDELGIEFENLDLAYLDAYRAAGDMWLELSRAGQDGSQHCFDIADSRGQLLIKLPFTEVLPLERRQKPTKTRAADRQEAGGGLTGEATARSLSLAVDIADLIAAAKRTIEQTQHVLGRASPSAGAI